MQEHALPIPIEDLRDFINLSLNLGQIVDGPLGHIIFKLDVGGREVTFERREEKRPFLLNFFFSDEWRIAFMTIQSESGKSRRDLLGLRFVGDPEAFVRDAIYAKMALCRAENHITS